MEKALIINTMMRDQNPSITTLEKLKFPFSTGNKQASANISDTMTRLAEALKGASKFTPVILLASEEDKGEYISLNADNDTIVNRNTNTLLHAVINYCRNNRLPTYLLTYAKGIPSRVPTLSLFPISSVICARSSKTVYIARSKYRVPMARYGMDSNVNDFIKKATHILHELAYTFPNGEEMKRRMLATLDEIQEQCREGSSKNTREPKLVNRDAPEPSLVKTSAPEKGCKKSDHAINIDYNLIKLLLR